MATFEDGRRRLYRIESVEFICVSSPILDGLARGRLGPSQLSPDFADTATPSYHVGPCADLRALLSSGTFYYSYDWDSTKTLQKLHRSGAQTPHHYQWEHCEKSFFWNHFLMKPLLRTIKGLSDDIKLRIQSAGPFVTCFRGFCQVSRLRLGQTEAQLVVISRVSCMRAGMRFLCRGIDDDGHVSNFVESETILAGQNQTFSTVIIRGTVPVFWDQQGFQLGFPRIQLTRSPVATQPAFDRHIGDLRQSYGLIHIIDLLNQKEGQAEHVLSHALDYHVRKYPEVGVLSQTVFDLYAVCKGHSYDRLEALFHMIGRDLQTFGYFVIDSAGSIPREQTGIFRVNCLDCLDRTNAVQSYISRRTTDLFLRSHLLGSGAFYDPQALHAQLSELWSLNGDQLSRIYAGSNAIKSSYGRLGKLTLSSLVEDIKSTARRFYLNNTDEKWRQRAIDLMLGKLTSSLDVRIPGSEEAGAPSNTGGATESSVQYLETGSGPTAVSAPSVAEVVVQVLTWNTNASAPLIGEDYSPLISRPKGYPSPHLVAVGFQEIVQLNATQIMSVDPERRIQWEGIIMKSLNESSDQPYSLLVAHQLVGTTVSVFVRADFMNSIRQVEIASKKTGMGGMVGNKGSVAVKLNVLGANLCFVSSHFTAGQAAVTERDHDMFSAVAELQMSGGRGILDNEVVFWFGDLNYRIDLDREQVRHLILEKDYATLFNGDQLQRRMREGLVFQNFKEEAISFAPTYKYDLGTNIYDSRYDSIHQTITF